MLWSIREEGYVCAQSASKVGCLARSGYSTIIEVAIGKREIGKKNAPSHATPDRDGAFFYKENILSESFITAIRINWICACGQYNNSAITDYDNRDGIPELYFTAPYCTKCQKIFMNRYLESIENAF